MEKYRVIYEIDDAEVHTQHAVVKAETPEEAIHHLTAAMAEMGWDNIKITGVNSISPSSL